MPTIRTGYSCPTCKATTGDVKEIVAEGRMLKCTYVASHTWNDSQDFLDLKPTIDFKSAPQPAAPQANHTNLNVSLPVNILNAVQEKYGEKLQSTIAGLLGMMAEGEIMIVGKNDAERISTLFNEKPKNGSHLFGLIYALQQSVEDSKAAAEAASKDLQAYQGLAPGRVVVNLEEHYQNARERAESEGMPLAVWASRNFKTAIENSWF